MVFLYASTALFFDTGLALAANNREEQQCITTDQ